MQAECLPKAWDNSLAECLLKTGNINNRVVSDSATSRIPCKQECAADELLSDSGKSN